MSAKTDATPSSVNLRSLLWVGPATVSGATIGVAAVQRMVVPLADPLPPALRFPMMSAEPLVFTAILVVAAVIVFAVIADNAADPIRTFRRIASGVLVISFIAGVAFLAWAVRFAIHPERATAAETLDLPEAVFDGVVGLFCVAIGLLVVTRRAHRPDLG